MPINKNSIRLHNFILDQIKKHLAIYNFTEVDTQNIISHDLDLSPDLLKIYSHDKTATTDALSIVILNASNIELYAYLIKMLDVFLMEKLKLENYALKLNPSTSQESDLHPDRLTKLLQILSVSYIVDPTLAQNSEVAFEFVSRDLGPQRVFISGGDCDICDKNSMQFQARINMRQLVTLAEKYRNNLLIPEKPALHVLIPINKEQNALALLLADKLQTNLLSTDLILENAAISDMLVQANRLGAKYVLIVGETEQQDGAVTIKNMQNGQSSLIKQSEIISYLK